MVDNKKTDPYLTIANYNSDTTRNFYAVDEDGDNVPTGRDTFFSKRTNMPAPLTDVLPELTDYYRFYHRFCDNKDKQKETHWFRFQQKGDSCTYTDSKGKKDIASGCAPTPLWYTQALDTLMSTFDNWPPDLSPFAPQLTKNFIDPENWAAHSLALFFVYQPQDKIDQLMTFLKSHSVPLSCLLTMERTAKARGNVELGHQLHELFASRNPTNELLKPQFVELPFNDFWGDPIYLEKYSASYWSWEEGKKKMFSSSEGQAHLAQLLGFFDKFKLAQSLWSDDDVRKGVKNLMDIVPDLYTQGIPPPKDLEFENWEMKLRQLTGNENTGAKYLPETHSIYLIRSASRSTILHEYGHRLMGSLDDDRGAYFSMWNPRSPKGKMVFDPEDCNQLNSVSEYGGECQKEIGEKQNEDAAETFLFVMRRHDWMREHSVVSFVTGHYFAPVHLPWSDDPRMMENVVSAEKKRGEMGGIIFWGKGSEDDFNRLSSLATSYSKNFAQDQLPPAHHGDWKQYCREMKAWLEKMDTAAEQSEEVRNKKIEWMEKLVGLITPPESAPKRPRIDLSPEKIREMMMKEE